jgi:anti-anti-sigma factor
VDNARVGKSATHEVEVTAADDLQSWLVEAISQTPRAAELQVDLSAVTFLDSTGIRALLLAQRTATAHAVTMCITGAHGRVESILKITGVFELLSPR